MGTCKNAFKGYGIMLAGGKNVLSGPGLKKNDELQAGHGAMQMGAIQMGGETWERRLGEVCRKLVYDKVGEDELYDMFFQEGGLTEDLCFANVGHCGAEPDLRQVKASSKQKKARKNTERRKKLAGKGVMDFESFLKAL